MVGGFDFGAFVSEANQLKQVPIDMLVPYHNHKFTLYEGERLDDMVNSVKENGVLTPIIVRKTDGEKYEILAGHNRVNAAELAGLTTVPAVIKENIPDDEAEMYVIETNLIQRGFEDLKITERAAVVAARHSAMFDDDKRKAIERELAILNGDEIPEETENGEKKSKLAEVGENYGLSKDTIARLIRIDKLADELKPLVDSGKIAVRAAVNLSYLFVSEQKKVAETLAQDGNSMDTKKSAVLKEISAKKQLNDVVIEAVISGQYNPDAKLSKPKQVKIKSETVKKYFAQDMDNDKIQEIIEKALEQYFNGNARED